MKIKKYSQDNYTLKSNLVLAEVKAILKENTLIKKNLTSEFTNKNFIGRIQEDTFSIFDSAPFPSGVACIIHGEIRSTSEITLTTTLHKGFRVLLLVWAIVMSAIFIGFCFIDPTRIDLLVFTVFMPIAIFLFRLVLHGYYVYTRNRALRKLRRILSVTE
jgi:hypothetical protein